MSLKHILLAILPALSGIAAPQKAALPYEPQLKAFSLHNDYFPAPEKLDFNLQ